MRRYHKNDNGFTMAEMLITVAIIVILCGFGFVAVIAHQRNLKRMEMDETAQEIFIAAQNHLTAAEANGQWDAFLKKTSGTNSEAARGVELANGPTGYDKTSDKDADSRKFYSFTTESNEAVQKGAASLILPEGSIDETLRGHHFYVEYDAMSGTVYGVFYTDADHDITADDAEKVSRTDPNARRDYKDANGKRTIIGYYGGALGELKNSEDLYAPAVAVRNAESLVLYVVDKNYHRPASSETSTGDSTQTSDENAFKTTLQLTFEGETSGAKTVKTINPATIDSQTDSFSKSVLTSNSTKDFQVVVPGREQNGSQKTVNKKAKYYAIVLDSIVRENGHFADLFQADDTDASKKFIPGEDIRITVTLHSDKGGEDVSQTVRVNSLFNSVQKEKNAFGMETGKAVVTVSNPRHLENLSTEISGVNFVSNKIVKDTAVDTVSVVRNLFWDEDAVAEAKEENEKETVTAFLPAIVSATGMESPFGYCADGNKAITKDAIQISQHEAGSNAGNDAAEIAKGACYGITNTAIQNFEGNNHMLAAFRFEGKQESALINRAAAVIRVSDLVIADSTSCVTGETQTGSDHAAEVPAAAMLIAKANSGYAGNDNRASVENVQIIWYPDGANKDGITTGNSKVTAAPAATGTMVYSGNGIASLLIGSVDANNRLPEEEGKTSQQGTPTNKFTIKNVTIQAGDFGRKKTANVGVEGNVTAGLIGEIKSGAVTIGNSDDQTDNWKTNIKIHGTLTLNAVKGEKSAAGGLVGKVADTASTQNDALTLQKVYLEADTLKMNGRKNQNSILGGFIGSVEGGKSVHIENADLIAKSVNGGMEEKNQEWNADTTGGTIGSVTAGTKTELKDVRLTTAEGKLGGKQASGGVVGSLASGEASLESVNVRAVNKNEAEGQGQSAVKTFRDIEVALSDNASLTINADNGSDSAAGGLIGNVSGQVSKLNITKSSVKTVTADDKNADLTVTGANIGGLIGVCGAATSTIGGDGDNEVILTVQGNFSLAQSTQEAKNAGGLIGKIGQTGNAGNAVTANVQNVPLTARTMHAYAAGDNNGNGTVGGFVGYVATGSSSVSLSSCNLSANSIDLGERETNNSTNTVKAAGGAVGKISAGTVTLSNLTVLTPKASQDAGEGANDNYIRVIADRGTAGGLVGVAESGTTRLEISNAAVSGSGVNDQIEAGGSAGGLVGDSKAGQMSITNSMASMYVQTDGITNVTDSSTGAGGLVGSASGTVTIQNSYSGGRTTRANDPEKAADSSTAKARYVDSTSGQGRYNVYLKASNGAAGGLIGYYAGSNLNVDNSYSTSSVAVSKINNNTYVGGFIGEADNLTARNTYCIGHVYENLGTGASTSTEKATTTPRYGTYVGKIRSFSAQSQKNYYLKGMKGAPAGAIGTLNGSSKNITIAENILTGADYYDNNCPLKQGAVSGQRSYYFDTALTGNPYPFKTYTAAYARTLYDPNTGEKVENADAYSSKYAQIGDWEIPAEESTEGTYGLIYYEKIAGNDTLYYHGYMFESGDDAQNATYQEVSSNNTSDPFVHDAGKYVEEDGYLLLVKKNIDVRPKLGIASQNTAIANTGNTLFSLNGAEEKNSYVQNVFENYKVYTLSAFEDKVEPFCRSQDVTSNFGVTVALWTETKNVPLAAFSYLPFFADTVQGADNGIAKNVSKAGNVNPVSGQEDDANAIIRSANQLALLSAFENAEGNAYLNGWKKIIIEQQMDIVVDESTFSNGYNCVFNKMYGDKSYPEYRSSLRKNAENDHDYYILKGLRKPFVGELQAAIIRNMHILDIRAPYFAEKLTYNTGLVENVYIEDAAFGKGDNQENITDGGFASYIQGAKIQNCHIKNAIIRGDGFAKIIQHSAEVKNCSIVNAVISGNGFASEINSATVDSCSVYADPEKFSTVESDKYYSKNYKPARNGNYGKLVIGVDNSENRSNQDIAGFVKSVGSGAANISNCSVSGMMYGQNIAGFVSEIGNGAQIQNCYANVVMDASAAATGFAFTVGSGATKVINCHALGTINAASNAVGGFDSIGNQAQILKYYEAFWNIKAEKWYPFYRSEGDQVDIRDSYYLRDYAAEVSDGELLDYSDKAEGLSYQQLCDLHIDDLRDQANSTVGYYQYMKDDNDHKTYPYPMPAGMTAYGDWSHADPDNYTLLYYEKVDEKYYFHGYTTENGETYRELKTAGDKLDNGLLAETGKTVEEDGYLLLAGTNSSWSSFGRADNSGEISSQVNNANTQILTSATDSDLLNALKKLGGLTEKDTDKIYIFQPDQYLNYQDTTKNFASWQTLTQESGGVGIAIYSTKGMTPMAKFSFQPFFADTVKVPNVVSQGTSNTSEITFATTKDGDQEHDYRIRSLRQLQALSDWDAGIWNKKTVADASNLNSLFDKDNTKRYSYLSTSNENYTSGLTIRQDMDINVDGANINFDRLDGNYTGRTYGDKSVMLQKINYDFADVVAPSGAIDLLVIDQANLRGEATTTAQDGDIAHGGQRELVEYNYGTIRNIIVQNSTLGSAGLVYQNGVDPQKALIRHDGTTGEKPSDQKWDSAKGQVACQYATTITYTQGKVGPVVLENCTVRDSSIEGTGVVWRNQGTYVTTPRVIKQYQYWYSRWQWTTPNTERVSDSTIAKYGWPTEEKSSDIIRVAVDATIENCQVIDCTAKGNGFAGENTVNTDESVGTSSNSNSGAKAKISNCQVYGTSDYADMQIDSASGTSGVKETAGFVGSNGKGAEIADCSVTGQVSAQKSAAGFVLTNDGAITGSYANTKITCKGQQGALISGFVLTNTGTIERSHSLGEESYQQSGTGNNGTTGFVVNNQKADGSGSDAVIQNCYAAIWQLTNLQGSSYVPFGSKGSGTDAGTYQNCYAMKISSENGYSGTYSASTAPTGVTYVSGDALKKQCGSGLGDAAAGGKTAAYQAELKSDQYPFPCGSDITNYGDWKLTDGVSEEAHTITLNAGNKAVFTEDLVRALSTDTAAQAASVNDASTNGTSSQGGVLQDTIPEEERREVQVELGEEETELDLSVFTPVRKGWKLLGWLITSPSDLSASEKKTTVSDIVTKINKISDGDADEGADAANTDDVTGTGDSENASEGSGQSRTETSGSSKAVYELETGTKSYHYAPDAVITVTEDMTLSAVWVPDDDTVEKAKDGTLRMDVNGNILDGEEQVTNDVTNETTETDSDASAADTSSAVTGDDTDGMTSENQDASTDQTADASGTLPVQNTEDDMSEMSDLTGESDPEMETSTETTGEEGDPAGE